MPHTTDPTPPVRDEEQEKFAALIEALSIDTLEAMKAGDINVDIEPLMNAVEAYSSFPQYNKIAVERWKNRLAEITDLLQEQYKKVQEEIKTLTDNNPKLAAYTKNTEIEE